VLVLLIRQLLETHSAVQSRSLARQARLGHGPGDSDRDLQLARPGPLQVRSASEPSPGALDRRWHGLGNPQVARWPAMGTSAYACSATVTSSLKVSGSTNSRLPDRPFTSIAYERHSPRRSPRFQAAAAEAAAEAAAKLLQVAITKPVAEASSGDHQASRRGFRWQSPR
jgi:hypothetical protein